MNLIQFVPLAALICIQVDGKPKKNNDYFNITEFEVLANRTTDLYLLEEPLQQVLNCSSIFSVSESMRHIKICAAEELDFDVSSRSRRRREADFIEPLVSDEKEDDVDDEDSVENIDDDASKTRTIRGIIISNDKLRAHLPWRFLEIRSIRETPCIGACILEELRVLNDTTDIPDQQMIVNRIMSTVTNISTEAAETIAERCINQYDRGIDKIQPSKGDVDVQKCQVGVKLAICLSKKSYDYCKGESSRPITAITKTRPKEGTEK